MKKLLIAASLFVSFGAAAQTSNGHASRYVFSPSGFGIEKDSAYLNVVGPLVDFQYGVSDHFSIGIGTPLFLGVYGTASYHTQIAEKLHVKAGMLAGVPIIGNGIFSLPFAVATYGTPENQFSIGGGYMSFNSSDLGINVSEPAVNIAGFHQMGRLGFVYEAWYLPETRSAILSPNFRIYTHNSRRYWNFGFASFANRIAEYGILGYDLNWDGIVDTQDPNLGGNTIYTEEPVSYAGWTRFDAPTLTFAMYL